MIEARVHWTVEIVLCQIKTSDDRAIDREDPGRRADVRGSASIMTS